MVVGGLRQQRDAGHEGERLREIPELEIARDGVGVRVVDPIAEPGEGGGALNIAELGRHLLLHLPNAPHPSTFRSRLRPPLAAHSSRWRTISENCCKARLTP